MGIKQDSLPDVAAGHDVNPYALNKVLPNPVDKQVSSGGRIGPYQYQVRTYLAAREEKDQTLLAQPYQVSK